MKNSSRKSWLIALMVLVSVLVIGQQPVVAQRDTRLIAVADGPIMLFAEPFDQSEVIAEVPPATLMSVVGTDESRSWLAVETLFGAGYVMMDDAIVLDLPVLAPQAYLEHASARLIPAGPGNIDTEVELPVGTVVAILGFDGQFTYVDTPLGFGWTRDVEWTVLPAATTAMMTGEADAPVWASADSDATIIRMLSPETLVYRIDAPVGDYVPVLLPEGIMGYMHSDAVIELPRAYVEANAGASAGAGVYAEPAHGLERTGSLLDGTRAFFLGRETGTTGEFIKIYHPDVGVVYGLANSFTHPYAVATIAQTHSIVRAGPNDNIYSAIALLSPNTPVVVMGINMTGAWIEVALPFAEIDYAYQGVAGWTRDFLFVDDYGVSDLDKSILAMTE